MRLDVTDNPVISGMSRIFDMMCLNVLWLVCSLPIFTIGASTTAMYTVMLKVVKNEEGYIVKGFFKAFKENFKKSTIIWLILLVIGGFLGADLYLTSSAKGSVGMALRAIFAALELLVLAVGIYAFGLTARYENSIKGTIRSVDRYINMESPVDHICSSILGIIWSFDHFLDQLKVIKKNFCRN